MYSVARKSTVRMLVDTMIPTFSDQDVMYYEWDAHAEKFTLPDKDLFGLVGFSALQHGQFHDLTFGVGLMTRQDMNISRLVSYVDLFYRRMQSQERYKIYNPDGTEAGFDAVFFEGTEASPMTRVDARPAQTVSCHVRLGMAGFVMPQV